MVGYQSTSQEIPERAEILLLPADHTMTRRAREEELIAEIRENPSMIPERIPVAQAMNYIEKRAQALRAAAKPSPGDAALQPVVEGSNVYSDGDASQVFILRAQLAAAPRLPKDPAAAWLRELLAGGVTYLHKLKLTDGKFRELVTLVE